MRKPHIARLFSIYYFAFSAYYLLIKSQNQSNTASNILTPPIVLKIQKRQDFIYWSVTLVFVDFRYLCVEETMIASIIKYTFLFLCAIYCYGKILSLNSSKRTYAMALCFSITAATIRYFLLSLSPYIVLLCIIFIFLLFSLLCYHQSLHLTIIASVIALGLGFASCFLSCLLLFPVGFILVPFLKGYPALLAILSQIFVGIFQCIICNLLFRIRRLKNGMPFLYKTKYSKPGAILCSMILLIFTLLSGASPNNNIVLSLLPLLLTLSALLIIWWKKSISQDYLHRLKKNELDSLYEELKKKDKEIETLRKDNERLAYLVHKDNKLIPAMEMGVRTLLNSLTDLSSSELKTNTNILTHHAKQLLKELEQLSHDRKGILTETDTVPFSKTGFLRIDSILAYMYERCFSIGIQFDCHLNCDLHTFLEHPLSESDVSTILADLIENALIATKDSSVKKIRLTFDCSKDFFMLNLYDSGSPFANEVLVKLGKERITTHASSGGSGIGLMTVYGIVQKYGGHLSITDMSSEGSEYMKCVRIEVPI